jgi:hypothetical protein
MLQTRARGPVPYRVMQPVDQANRGYSWRRGTVALVVRG